MISFRPLPNVVTRLSALTMMGTAAFIGCKEKKESGSSANTSAGQFAAQAAETPQSYPEVEALRNSIPEGQVLLPDDPAFRKGIGWWEPAYTLGEAGWYVTCWTKGEYQMLSWNGPEKPGEYDVTIEMWRHHPIPSETIKIEYVLPGAEEPVVQEVPVGMLVITGKVQIVEPGQKLHLKMKVPSWIPMDSIPGSTDPRDIGMMLGSIKLSPAPSGEVAVEVPQNTDPVPEAESTN